jgi:hypothetical protein
MLAFCSQSLRSAVALVNRNVEVNDDELRFIASDELRNQELALLKPDSSSQI